MNADIGLIGLAVMGENLALNMESKGLKVAVYNRIAPGEEGIVDRFMQGRGKGKSFVGCHSIIELANAIKPPRKIMMMVKSGAPVDELITQLIPHLSKGDVIIDGGNSDFHDTQRRVKDVESYGLYFIGTGISGGQEGALNGPSIMPGGSEAGWPLVKDIFQNIAAKLDDGTPCCEWIGKGGAGHFVKTVHNGIEYGDMQLISEAYALLKHRIGLTNEQMATVFESWNKGELNSFLIEITANILRYKDQENGFLLDHILDVAGQKGTGKWSAISALEEGDTLTLINEAVSARLLSTFKEERQEASKLFPQDIGHSATITAEDIRQALYAAKIISYAQGFSLLHRTSKHYGWNLNLGDIAKIWRNGCIIRSAFLQKITEAYSDPELENLIFDNFFREKIQTSLSSWRKVLADAILGGIAMPASSSAISYFDGLRTYSSPANMIQAQRDYFGAHTYERTDSERGKFFHTDWTGKGGNTSSGSYNA